MKITVEAEREIFPPGIFFKICFLIILRHNLAENRETGTCKCYVASDPVLKSLTQGGAVPGGFLDRAGPGFGSRRAGEALQTRECYGLLRECCKPFKVASSGPPELMSQGTIRICSPLPPLEEHNKDLVHDVHREPLRALGAVHRARGSPSCSTALRSLLAGGVSAH